MDREKRASEIMVNIGNILLNDWDPIGVRQVPEAQDEYEGYIGGVYRLLANRASLEEIYQHLAQIEEETMGLGKSNPESLQAVAQKLIKVDVLL